MKKQTTNTPSTRKVRRDVRGGKRGPGHEMQRHGRRVRRPDPRRANIDTSEKTVTGVAGLAEFGAFCREEGVDRRIAALFSELKKGHRVVYPMQAQIRLLIDLNVIGEGRVFGLEAVAHDPLFVHLAGGAIPSIDVLYDDLGRFDDEALITLEQLMAQETLDRLRRNRPRVIHVDIDTTVTTLFGSQEGAEIGYNPRHHGRPSYHPMLARVAEIQGVCGALLRPGDRGFGGEDVPTIVAWLERLRCAVGPECIIRVRIDAAGDCTELLAELERLGVHFYVKACITPDMVGAVASHSHWSTTDSDAMNRPTRQVATVDFRRTEWVARELSVRVIAVRSRERDNGKQVFLWQDLDYSAQCYLTNDWAATAEEVAAIYDGRAGVEPVIGELKGAWCIGKAPSASFNANHAAFLLKLLAYNLFRAFLVQKHAPLAAWRTSWARGVTILRPGRMVRSGRRRTIRTIPVRTIMQC